VQLASLPEQVRGFGHVKEKAVAAFHAEKSRLLALVGQQRAAA
jgi:indolepyruvate ferredoxin oxidoreductase